MKKYYKNAVKKIVKKELEPYFLLFLLIGCILFIFSNIGLYPLIDIDETRYVNMSKYMYLTKEYITPMLNFEPFLEKPPLYFWLNSLSFKLLAEQSLFASRFATALVSTFGVFFTYFFAKKITNDGLYGFLCANVLLASAWFLVFSHVAILDLNFMVFSMCAIYCAVIPLFEKKENPKKVYWYLGYIFCALSILAKGFIGLAIPCMVVFFTYLVFGKTKELFKPIYIIPGIVLFLLIALPWHILIYKAHGQAWVNMYILKHHFARLLNSQGLGRKQPFLFYVPILILGLTPWCFNFVIVLIRDTKRTIKKIKASASIKEFFTFDSVDKKIMTFAYIYFFSTFLFFSSASTKLPPYILTVFPSLSLIVGNLWYRLIENKENKKEIKISSYINSILFLVISFLGLIFAFVYKSILPSNIEFYINDATGFAIPALVYVFIVSLYSFILIKKEKFVSVFIMHLALMLGAVYVTCDFGIPYYTSFAQDELEEYAQFINQQKNSLIVTYGFSTKYSILNPKKKIKYIVATNKDDQIELMKFIKKNRKKNVFVLTRTKNNDLENRKIFKKVKEGKVYRIYVDNLR